MLTTGNRYRKHNNNFEFIQKCIKEHQIHRNSKTDIYNNSADYKKNTRNTLQKYRDTLDIKTHQIPKYELYTHE